MVRHPSVIVHTFKLEYLWSQLANLDQILCVASLGWGKGCIRFWGRLDQNSSFHGNRKPPLTYNGENNVSTFSRLFFYLILFILAGNEDMHKITDKFEFLPDRTTDYGDTPLSVPIDFEWGKWCRHLFSVAMNSDFIKLTGNEDRHKILDRFEFWSYLTSHFGVACPSAVKKWCLHFSTFSLSPLIGSLSNLQVMRTGIKARKSSNLGQIG